jgi:hypothetical protein
MTTRLDHNLIIFANNGKKAGQISGMAGENKLMAGHSLLGL